MPTSVPLTLTLAELAARWTVTPQQALERAIAQALPAYFYFDGLVFEFGDKWLRAHGDVEALHDLEAHEARLSNVAIDLQRQGLHKRGLLKLTQWETALDDEALRQLQVESDKLTAEIARLTALLKQRTEERQRRVRNGLLRAATRTLHEMARDGRTALPAFAFMPFAPGGTDETPRSDDAGDGSIAGGALVALEDGFPHKAAITPADLVVAMQDVLALDAPGL